MTFLCILRSGPSSAHLQGAGPRNPSPPTNQIDPSFGRPFPLRYVGSKSGLGFPSLRRPSALRLPAPSSSWSFKGPFKDVLKHTFSTPPNPPCPLRIYPMMMLMTSSNIEIVSRPPAYIIMHLCVPLLTSWRRKRTALEAGNMQLAFLFHCVHTLSQLPFRTTPSSHEPFEY